jgi:hypothetical protein
MNKNRVWFTFGCMVTMAVLAILYGCPNPKYIRDAHNYDPPEKAYSLNYWVCESAEEYFWGDCNWGQGLYLKVDGIWRTVGFSFCVGSDLDYGYGLNAVMEDRARYGPLAVSELGSQRHMHCKMNHTLMTFGNEFPIGKHDQTHGGGYGRVIGFTMIGDDGSNLSVVGSDDNTTETRGHEGHHGYWEGDWHGENWTEENPMDIVGVQPSGLRHVPRQKWVSPDLPPTDAYARGWHINRGQPKPLTFDELQEVMDESAREAE